MKSGRKGLVTTNMDPNQEEIQDEQQEDQPPVDEKESMIAELKAALAKQTEQIERQNQGYRELRAETDRIKDTTAAEMTALLKAQLAQSQPQRNDDFNTITDPDKLSHYAKQKAAEIRKRYADADISEEQKDEFLFEITTAYSDKKAQLLAERALAQAKTEYEATHRISSAQSEWQSVFQGSGLDNTSSDIYKVFMECANDGLFDYEKARIDPAELKRGLAISKRISGKPTTQNTQQNSFSAPSGAVSGTIPATEIQNNVNPYFQSEAFKEIQTIAIQQYGPKLAGEMMKKIKANYEKGS